MRSNSSLNFTLNPEDLVGSRRNVIKTFIGKWDSSKKF